MTMWKLLHHRDFVLGLALLTGILLGERTRPLAEVSLYSLSLVMVFSTTAFSFRDWLPIRTTLRQVAWAALLNFGLFAGLLILAARLVFGHAEAWPFFAGFILVAAAPPGPSVIPFSTMLRGDQALAITGVFGLHLAALVITPLMLLLFLGQAMIAPADILLIMGQLIVIPLIISRLLRHPKVIRGVERIRAEVVKWGFFLVITPIIGMGMPVLKNQPAVALTMSLILLVVMFAGGLLLHLLMRRRDRDRGEIISSTLLMVTKSSAFAAVAAFRFFEGDGGVALPAAVVSLFVTLFILYYARVVHWLDRRPHPSRKA